MKKKILFIVDDDEDDINLFVEAVNEIDCTMQCFQARNGLDALERLNALDLLPEIIFLDLNMPKMNGFEVLERLKSMERYKEIPVVIYSTSRDADEKQKAIEMGASDYLVKPDSFTQLCIGLSRTIRIVSDPDELNAVYYTFGGKSSRL